MKKYFYFIPINQLQGFSIKLIINMQQYVEILLLYYIIKVIICFNIGCFQIL